MKQLAAVYGCSQVSSQSSWYTVPYGSCNASPVSNPLTAFPQAFAFVYIFAPLPRLPDPSELAFKTVKEDGTIISKISPCWHDKWLVNQEKTDEMGRKDNSADEAEVLVTMVVPAYNEQERLLQMMEEAVTFLEERYGNEKTNGSTSTLTKRNTRQNGNSTITTDTTTDTNTTTSTTGWELLIVSDGSTDKTTSVALNHAKSLSKTCSGSIRVISLTHNRGKGGAVIHGMRHARGAYIGFADADGASKFADLEKLIEACQAAEDKRGRAFAVGSRAHLVGSETVVRRSKLRNFLMHSFHLLLRLLTPPATSRIRDTQCGFKLFSRAAMPYIVPHMHSEGWIFDVEMLMLAERAGIPMVEVPIGWHEVKGSKLNVVWDSLGMAWGLGILRLAWGMGIYQT